MQPVDWNAPRPGQPAFCVIGARGAYLARYPFGPGQVASEPAAKSGAYEWLRRERDAGRHAGAVVRRYSGVVAASWVYIVEGESDSTPGRPVNVFADESAATARAVELTNTLLKEAGLPDDATPDNWRDRVEALEDETGGGSWVALNAHDLEA